MKASEIMTREVVAVRPEMPVRQVAKLLLEHGVSAVPVIDATGAPLGMVSEGDLIGRNDTEREARRDWWLALLAEGEALHPDFLASVGASTRTARDIMSAPLVTVEEGTETIEIARLLATYHIKRVPVLRAGRIVGIVSRADLLRAVAANGEMPPPPRRGIKRLLSAIPGIDAHFLHREDAAAAAPAAPPLDAAGLKADDFRSLVAESKHEVSQRHAAERRAAAAQRRGEVKALIEHHVADGNWQSILHQAREAAERGAKEFMLLRFPHELCSDGGRAINAPEPGWPKTLRGEAAEIYLRWERDLRPQGFHLSARVLDFPGGFPGDIGLFLIWGE